MRKLYFVNTVFDLIIAVFWSPVSLPYPVGY